MWPISPRRSLLLPAICAIFGALSIAALVVLSGNWQRGALFVARSILSEVRDGGRGC